MSHLAALSSVRTRLFIAIIGSLLLGFGALALAAGDQISSAARQDFEQRLGNEVRLVGRTIGPYLGRYAFLGGDGVDVELTALIASLQEQVGGELRFFQVLGSGVPFQPQLAGMPEVETALRGGIAVAQRRDRGGELRFYTAAPAGDLALSEVVVQLSVPSAQLDALIAERWTVLGLIFALVTVLAVAVTVALARSIIRPLETLRESARRLSQGDLAHRVAYARPDEIGQVAVAFHDMARQVQSMLDEQRAFASNTSHELRTPLTAIRLRSEALRGDALDAETAAQYIAEIDDEVRRLGALIEDLTLLSRFDAGRAELGHGEVDLGRLAANLVQAFLPQAAARGVTLDVAAPTADVTVQASLTHLTVVLRNLLDNAIKYTPHGGRVACTLSPAADAVSVTITDTGQGIAPEDLPKVFERFYRADKARSRDVPGSGLGLALVQSIVTAYGGRVALESAGLGQGATARLWWPRTPRV